MASITTDKAGDEDVDAPPISSGVPGIDDILRGGFSPDCAYLITGTPGEGKTTLAMSFLLEGARQGEPCLYITLSESRKEISKVARSHGWNLAGISICELIPSERNLPAGAQLTVFNPSELELGDRTQRPRRGRACWAYEGRISRDAVARAAHAAQRDPRVVANPLDRTARRGGSVRGPAHHRAKRQGADADHRRPAGHEPHHQRQGAPRRPADGLAAVNTFL